MRSGKLVQARTRLFPQLPLLMGVATGLMAVVFRTALETGNQWRALMLQVVSGWEGLVMLVIVATAMIGVSLWLARRSSAPRRRAAVFRTYGSCCATTLRCVGVLPVKFLSGLFAIVGGLCLGREGPTIQMGAVLSAMWGDSYLGRSADPAVRFW